MASRVKYVVIKEGTLTEEDQRVMEHVHFAGVSGQTDSTLCGMAFEGSFEPNATYGAALISVQYVSEKVTCPDCVAHVKAIKAIKRVSIFKDY